MSFSVLFLADTHLGFDCPARPRVDRRRRCEEFFANFHRVIDHAINSSVDLFIHGGDVFFRSKVRSEIVERVIFSLRRLVSANIPVYIVPGNHERSALPCPVLWNSEQFNVFDIARSFTLTKDGQTLLLAGFPYSHKNMGENFAKLLHQSAYGEKSAHARLLCLHHIVESSIVGPHNYCFQKGADVIPLQELPQDFAAILSGHIHTFQILQKDRKGGPLPCPVYYPGSTCRTSFAERLETKGFLTLEIEGTECSRGKVSSWKFHSLPSRSMEELLLQVADKGKEELQQEIMTLLEHIEEDAILRLKIVGEPQSEVKEWLTNATLRQMAPKTMNIELNWPREGAR